MLVVGLVMIVMGFQEQDAHVFEVAALAAPGLIITVITQAHWSRHKSEYTDGGDEQRPATAPVEDSSAPGPVRRRTRQRRRGRARARGRR